MATAEVLDAMYLTCVTLCGVVGKYGVHKSAASAKTPHARFDLEIKEQGLDERVRTVYLTIEAWGKPAGQAATLAPGQLAVVEGKLARARRAHQGDELKESWRTIVQAWRIQAFNEWFGDDE